MTRHDRLMMSLGIASCAFAVGLFLFQCCGCVDGPVPEPDARTLSPPGPPPSCPSFVCGPDAGIEIDAGTP